MLGAVLAGGASRRMGRPKVLTPVDGVALGTTVARALRSAGADRVVVVGGEAAWATELGLDHVPDSWPGIGPLGGIATAVGAARSAGAAGGQRGGDGGRVEVVLVAACDQPALSGAVLAALVHALVGAPADVAAAAFLTADGRRHPLPSAWRPTAADALAELVGAGARRADAGFAPLGVIDVVAADQELVDLDAPEDVVAWEARRRP